MESVSIILASYNGSRFIREQLSSLAAQTYPALELIISDDGSSDNTMEIVEEFSQTVRFPVIVRRNDARVGYAENFLSAAKLATGTYVAFCDQDDKWKPQKIAIAIEEISRSKADLFVHTATLIDVDGNETGRFSQGIHGKGAYNSLQMGPWAVFYGCCMVFRRELLDLIDPDRRGPHPFEFEGLLSHDLWIYFLANSIGKIVLDYRPLIFYRQHNHNQTPHVQTTMLRAWWISAGVAAHPRLARGQIAKHRQKLMEYIANSSSHLGLHQAATRAARYWKEIERYEIARVEVYTAPRLAQRAMGWSTLVCRGGYRTFSKGGLGWQLSIKDLLLGVLKAKYLKRSNKVSAPPQNTTHP